MELRKVVHLFYSLYLMKRCRTKQEKNCMHKYVFHAVVRKESMPLHKHDIRVVGAEENWTSLRNSFHDNSPSH